MPIYEYVCGQCERTIDVLQKVSEPAPEKCECGAEGSLSRKVSRTSFVLKGGGWYSDLYSSVKKDGGSSPGGASSSSSGSSASSDSGSGGSGSSSSGSSSGGGSTGSTSATAAAPTR